jgi:excisionase family DNA binding protein
MAERIERMLSAGNLADLTGWHVMTVYRKAAAGEIPGRIKLGKSVRFRESKIIEWLEDPAKVLNEQPSPTGAV